MLHCAMSVINISTQVPSGLIRFKCFASLYDMTVPMGPYVCVYMKYSRTNYNVF